MKKEKGKNYESFLNKIVVKIERNIIYKECLLAFVQTRPARTHITNKTRLKFINSLADELVLEQTGF